MDVDSSVKQRGYNFAEACKFKLSFSLVNNGSWGTVAIRRCLSSTIVSTEAPRSVYFKENRHHPHQKRAVCPSFTSCLSRE